jgi:hypothetical protein
LSMSQTTTTTTKTKTKMSFQKSKCKKWTVKRKVLEVWEEVIAFPKYHKFVLSSFSRSLQLFQSVREQNPSHQFTKKNQQTNFKRWCTSSEVKSFNMTIVKCNCFGF